MIIQYFPHTLKNPIRPTIHTHLLHLWAVVFTITVITHLWLHRSVRKWEQQWLLPPTDHCHTKNTRSLRPMPTDKTGWKKKKSLKKKQELSPSPAFLVPQLPNQKLYFLIYLDAKVQWDIMRDLAPFSLHSYWGCRGMGELAAQPHVKTFSLLL